MVFEIKRAVICLGDNDSRKKFFVKKNYIRFSPEKLTIHPPV